MTTAELLETVRRVEVRTNRLANDATRCCAFGLIVTTVKVVALIGQMAFAAQAYEGPGIRLTRENITTHAPFIALTNHVENEVVNFRVVVSPIAEKQPRDFVGWLDVRDGGWYTPRDKQQQIAFTSVKAFDLDAGGPERGKKIDTPVVFEFRIAIKFLESSDFTLWETVSANYGMTGNKFRLVLASFLNPQSFGGSKTDAELPRRFKSYHELYTFIARCTYGGISTNADTLFKLAADSTTTIVTIEDKSLSHVYLIEPHFYGGGIHDQIRGAQGNGNYYILRPLATNQTELDVDKGFELVGIARGNSCKLSYTNGRPCFVTRTHFSATENPLRVYQWNGMYFDLVK